MKRYCIEILMGMLVASFIYVVTGIYTDRLTLYFKIIFLGSGALIGLCSELFYREPFNIIITYALHAILTFIIISGMNVLLYHSWFLLTTTIFFHYVIQFALIYVVVCVIAIIATRKETDHINQSIQKRRHRDSLKHE
jgi:hypothetical protein